MGFVVVGALVVLLAGVALAIGYAVRVYNTLIQVRSNCDKAWHNIDVLLQQRHDELIKLAEACKGYMKHERDVLERIVGLRAGYDRAAGIDEKVQLENEMTRLFAGMRLTWEAYPELRANQSFLQLMERISAVESSIADRRELFNDSVNIYNVRIASFPEALVARNLSFSPRSFLEVPVEVKSDVELGFAEPVAAGPVR